MKSKLFKTDFSEFLPCPHVKEEGLAALGCLVELCFLLFKTVRLLLIFVISVFFDDFDVDLNECLFWMILDLM
jgi:hypothetical protein